MPIWLRTFTFNKLKEWYNKEEEQIEKQNNQLTNKSGKEIARPDIPQPIVTGKQIGRAHV